MASQIELTPCGAMFDIFERAAHRAYRCYVAWCFRAVRWPMVAAPRAAPPIAPGSRVLSCALRSARCRSAILPITEPRPRASCRIWPCADAIP